jgi:hypothetical protein
MLRGACLLGLGDAGKTSGTVGLFITKYPGKTSAVARILARHVLKYVPFENVKLAVLDKIYKGVATRLRIGDITADDLLKVVDNGARRPGDLSRTLGVVKHKLSGEVRWLEEGTNTWGWTKIREVHWSDIEAVFGPKTEDEVKEMIFKTLKESDTIEVKEGSIRYTMKFLDDEGKPQLLHVVVSDRVDGIGRGNVVTAFPEEIK